MHKYLKFFLKLAVSLGFVAWIILKTDWAQVLQYLSEIDLWKLVVYVLLIVFGIAISAHKWRLLANFKNISRHSFRDFYQFYLTGTFINNFMPSFIGGDTFRAYQIGHAEKKYIESASSVVADRITGFVAMTILALLFGLLNLQQTLDNKLLLLIYSILLLSFLLDILIAKTRDWRLWKKFLALLPQKIARFITELQDYSRDSGILTKTIFWGMIFQFVGVALANLVLFWALDIQISLLNYFSVIFLISLISSIPISINNIGLKEWAYVTFFGIYGLESSALVTIAILSRFIQMVISFLALPAYLKTKK
ncbi:MAG: lysylphosphatidylglycerol synthase transmembrane domain-containing protein [Parcubacteria group bacterium]